MDSHRKLLSVAALTLFLVSGASAPADAALQGAGDYTPTGQIPEDGPKPDFVTSARRLFTAPELPDAPDQWIDHSLQWVDFTLDSYKPALVEPPLRRAALIRIDDILHIPSAPQKKLVQAWYRARMERAVKEIEQTKVTHGMRIWKLYNHGFLVRTPTVTFAFDIVAGVPRYGFVIPLDLIDRLVAQTDVLFISHGHPDHADLDVVRRLLAAKKPVVAPEQLWKDQPDFAGAITVFERSTGLVHNLPVQAGKRTLRVVAYPGYQDEVLNNITLVTTPEELTVVQTGDEWQQDTPGSDFDWISSIARDRKVDVLLPNIWSVPLDRLVRGINPALVISGHENEMGHSVAHREDYTQSYNRLFGIPYPALVMTWGESFQYDRSQVARR